jgi:uncharacterized protein
MMIKDQVYGCFEIDGLLEELLLSAPVQRLKGIHQGGACYLVCDKWNVTRYEHSVGVMLLIRKLGGCLEEQVVGLLHDISHIAFSHVIDFVFDNRAEEYHEEIFEEVVEQSEIPSILSKYGLNYCDILLDHSQWTILEYPAPDLCADRVDYTLRDLYTYDVITRSEVDRFMQSLTVQDGKICVTNVEMAEWFTRTYYKEVHDFFMDPLNVYAYDRLAKTLKLALEKGILVHTDFMRTDEEIVRLLENSTNEQVRRSFSRLNPHVQVCTNEEQYDIHLHHKVRLIDPTVAVDGHLFKASDKSSLVKRMNDRAMCKAATGACVRIIQDGVKSAAISAKGNG